MSSADRASVMLMGAAQVSAVVLSPAQPPTATEPIALADHVTEHALSALRALVSEADVGARLRIIVSDAWLSSVELPWANALLNEAECSTHVNLHLDLMGVNAADSAVLIDDAPFGAPRLAVAMPRPLLDGLARLAAERSSSVTIQPLSLVVHGFVARQTNQRDYAFAVVERGAATIAVVRDNRVQQVATQYLCGDASAEVGRWWRRLLLRDPGLKNFDTLHVVDLSESIEAADEDLLRVVPLGGPPAVILATATSRARPTMVWQVNVPTGVRGLRRIAVAASVLLLVASIVFVVMEQRSVKSGQARLEVFTETPARKPGVQSRAEQERLTGLQEQLRALEMPLDHLLSAMRPPSPLRTAVLGIELSAPRASAASATVRLTVEAASSEDMVSYVSHLAHTAPFTEAHLTRHEISAPGIYRFTVEASWAP